MTVRRISPVGALAIKRFEACRLDAYRDAVGVWTIGWGSTTDVTPGMHITQDEAERRFQDDLIPAETAVSSLVKVPLTDGQFAALVSFTFNCGAGTLRTSTLLRLLNGGDYAAVPAQLRRFRFAHGIELKGLAVRREAEIALWKGGADDADLVADAAAHPKAGLGTVTTMPVAPAAAASAPPSAATKAPTMTKTDLAAAHPQVAAAVPNVDFFQGILNFGEHFVSSLGAGAAAIANPSLPGITGQPSTSGFFGTIENVRSAASKVTEIVADAKAGDVQEGVADGVDLLKLIFATLDIYKINVPVLGGVVESLGSIHSGGVDKSATA